jgi:signal transduction histidine kinase
MIDTHTDPLHEVRVAKRWAIAGISLAVALLLPVYAFLLGLGLTEVVFVLAPAACGAYIGIELGSRWEYRMRRRYAYPHRLGLEMAAVHDFRLAGRRGADLVGDWFKARSVVVAWVSEDAGVLLPIAVHGKPEGWVEAAPPIPLDGRSLKEACEGGRLSPDAGAFDGWFGPADGQRTVLVPLVSRDSPEGVLLISARRRNPLLRDQRLLAAIGMVMGLALENARLYGDQRAHAQRLQELNRMKSDFLTTVSHELRTPLTSIMMAAEMLLEEEEAEDPDSTRTKLVSNITKGASRLRVLVSDLVNVSREDEFQPRLELDRVPLADVIGNAVSIIQPLAAAKHQVIEVDLGAPDVFVFVDRLRFDQVLINLLSNAQRYSPPGGRIKLSTRLEKDEVVIRVTDSGPGVSDEVREMIFEPFYRGDRSGLGLGLAIAKSLVELHNGRIWVENRRNGRGGVFCVALPAPGAVSEPERAPSAAAAG